MKKFKKTTNLILLVLLLCGMVMFTACNKKEVQENTFTETEQSLESEIPTESRNESDSSGEQSGGTTEEEPNENVPKSSYELFYTSNSDGTCYVSDVKIPESSENLTLEIPEISPTGERVVAYNTNALFFQSVPRLISEEDFIEHIKNPLMKAVREGKLTQFAYQKQIEGFFTEKSLEKLRSDKAKETLLASYPIVAATDIYEFSPDATDKEFSEVAEILMKYANYTTLQAIADAKHLIEIGNNKGIDTSGIILPNHTDAIIDMDISDSIVSLCKGAFGGCTKLIQLENGVSYVDNWAVDCDEKATNVTLRENTVGFGNDAFASCASLTSIIIPNGVTSIGNGAFASCESLTSITIPNGVTSIGAYCFENCLNLTSVIIPDSVIRIDRDAFLNCENLEKVYLSDLVAWCNLSFARGGSNPLSYGADLYLNNELVTSLKIPDGIVRINLLAFYGCSSIVEVTIPDSVKWISGGAFDNCANLKSVVVPNGILLGRDTFCPDVTIFYVGTAEDWGSNEDFGWNWVLYSESQPMEYGKYWHYVDGIPTIWNTINFVSNGDGTCHIKEAYWGGFFECPSYSSTGDFVTSIDAGAFEKCNFLTGIIIPESVTTIGIDAFAFCEYLESVTISDGVKNIGSSAFYGCTNLFNIVIPNSVTNLGASAFEECTNLTSVTLSNKIKFINEETFRGCKSLTSIIIPNNVTSIGEQAFSDCSSLTGITIPNSVTSIGYQAFYNCSSLTSVTIGNSVTSIGYNAFRDCSKLTSITIPDSVTSIGYYAFEGCSSLTNVYYAGAAEDWSKISIDSLNSSLTSATRYYYSETQPTTEGNYWRYVDGVPTKW